MIQRIQTIWLLLAAMTISLLFFLPMVTATSGTTGHEIYATGLYQKIGSQSTQVESNMPLTVMTIAVALMVLINIFNFRKREAQKKIIIASIVFIIALSFWCSRFAQKIPEGLENADYKAGMFLPVVAIFFCILALRGIRNDEKLLRSADRLR
ncbi:MAG: DUF4293 domain-containing protein [Pedobacter sp.]|nr:DUF4293 domain-containing protein [Pedobacter sp.]MDQ8054104.1 DUF4293 domain-containing protein [Pedobacter sp.]